MTRRLSILGATGSIGTSTLDVVRTANQTAVADPAFEILALVAGKDFDSLMALAKEFRPKRVVLMDTSRDEDLKSACAPLGIDCGTGLKAVLEASAIPVDLVIAAISGTAGLQPTLAAINAGSSIGLANKEAMVCAGPLIQASAARSGASIIPVDSEHNAIFQVLQTPEAVEKLILTASGGPFIDTPIETLRTVTPEDALNHPKWSMGVKNSLDSATMMNKGLEIIEAAYLFDMSADQIDVVVHPQSIVHSLVAYVDGSVLAQLGDPDMRTPIANALAWPDRITTTVSRLNLAEIGRLDFQEPDATRFPALNFAREAVREGPVSCAVFNAANEVAGRAFLNGACGFMEISEIVNHCMHKSEDRLHNFKRDACVQLDTILHVDTVAREIAREKISALNS